MLYRILTERKNTTDIATIVSRHFDGFTMLEGHGYWKLRPEPCLIIEIETDEGTKVSTAASEIKHRNLQDAVMVQRIPNNAWLV